MELVDVMRSAAGIREFDDKPVAPDVLARVLDNARFAPSGMNRQPWRVVAIADRQQRLRIGTAFASVWDDLVQERIQDGRMDPASAAVRAGTQFAHEFADVPLQLAVWVETAAVDVTDAVTQVPSIVAGGSVFPFIQNVILACRNEGLGARLTTLLASDPRVVRDLLGVPAGYSLASIMAVGYPRRWPRRLTRRPVSEFATWDRFDGEPIEVGVESCEVVYGD